jgi:excisionase family DNA binding protein
LPAREKCVNVPGPLFSFLKKIAKVFTGLPNILSNGFKSKGGKKMSSLGEDRKRQTKQSLTDSILTVHELAAYLRLTETTVCKLAASGESPGFKIGKSWRFDRDEILGRIAAAKRKGKESA